MNEYRHYRGRGRGNYQHGKNYRNQLGNNIYGSDARRCNPNHFSPLLPFPPFREARPRWQRPPQHNNWRGTPAPAPTPAATATPSPLLPPPAPRHYTYVRAYSPSNIQKQQNRALSPLPGSEEARQKAIAEASARIKQQLNLAEGDGHYEECSSTDETSNNMSDDCIILNEISSLEGTSMVVNSKAQDKKRKHKKCVNNTATIEELRRKILAQFTYMSKGKIQNLVNNPGSTRYDNALQHLVRDMRLHLSSELRNMYTNRDADPANQHNKMIDHFNSIVPDLGIELVSLPDTMVAELSKILQLDVNNEIEEDIHPNENALVEPEDMFKQAEQLLSSTEFLNVPFDSINTQNDESCRSFPETDGHQVANSSNCGVSVSDVITPTCTINSNSNIRFDEDNTFFFSQINGVPVVPTDNSNSLDVIPLPEIQQNENHTINNVNVQVERNKLNIPLPEEPEEPEELEEVDDASNTATIKSVDALRDTPVRDDSSPFSKKILQDPIYENAFKINISNANEESQPQINTNFNSVQIELHKNTNSELNASSDQAKTDTSNSKLNVTSFLQDVSTNNLLDLPKEKPNDMIDKRNKFICEASCESSKSLTDRNEECAERPFSRTRSHSPYDLSQHDQKKMTNSRLSLDERIKEMMKIQETRAKPTKEKEKQEQEQEQVSSPSVAVAKVSRRKRKRERKYLPWMIRQQKRSEKEKQKEIERMKQIEKEKLKKVEINALKELLKRQQKELEKSSNKVKSSETTSELTVKRVQHVNNDKTQIVENNHDTNSITSNLLNLTSVTCNLKKSVSEPSKIPIKLISKTKSKTVKTEPDIDTSVVHTVKIKDEPISEQESTTSSSSENETETSTDNLSETNNIIHNLTKDILNPSKLTKNIRHFENIDNNLNITNKILETPIKNFKIIVETNPVSISQEPVNTITTNQNEESQKNCEDATNLESTKDDVNHLDNIDIIKCEVDIVEKETENNVVTQENNEALIERNEVKIESENVNQIQLEEIDENKCNEEQVKGNAEEKKNETRAAIIGKETGEEESKCSDKKHTIEENNKASDKKMSNSDNNNKKSEVSPSSHKKSSSSSSKKLDDNKKHRHGSVDRKKEEPSKTSKLHKKSDSSKHKMSDSKASTSTSSHNHHHYHQHNQNHHHSDHQSGKQKTINRLLDIDLQIQKLMQEKWNLYKELNIANIEQLSIDGVDTNSIDALLLLNKGKQSKGSRLSGNVPETKTKETPETNVKHISTQTDFHIIEKPVGDVEFKKSKHKETKKTSTIKSDAKRKETDSAKNLRKRKLSESEGSIASMNIQESISVEHVEHSTIASDSETKKLQKTKNNKTRQTRNSLNQIDDKTDNTNVIPKLKINLSNVKSKMIKHVQNKDDDSVDDEIITKPNNQSDDKIVDENNTNNKMTKGFHKKLRSKKIVENDAIIPATITTTPINPIESKDDTILVINTRKRTTKSKKKSQNELIVNLADDKLIEDKNDTVNSELNDVQIESKHEEINDNIIKCDSTKRKSKKENKTKIDDEIDDELNKKKGTNRKKFERRNSRNRSATPSSSSSIIETFELKSEAMAVGKRTRKRKTNIEANNVNNKKMKLTKVEPEMVQVSSNSNKVNSDEEVENLLGFNVDICKEASLAVLSTDTEEISSGCANEEITANDDNNMLIGKEEDLESEQKRKQIKHNRKLNKIVTDNVSTDSIDNIYVEDDVNVTSYNKLVKTCFVQLERINIRLNEDEQEEMIKNELNDDDALRNDENLNDILLNEIDFNILNEEKCNEHFLDKLSESPKKEVDVIDENGMFCMGHQKSILDIKIVGDEFFAASEDGTIYKYCLKSGTLQDAYTGHKRAVTCIYTINGGFLNIESTLLYSGSLDCSLKCYNIETAEVVHSVTVAQAIQCLDSAWGYIFLGTYEGLLFIYDMKKKLLNEDSLTIANATVLMIKATQEGSRQVLILASRKREIMVRDAFTGLLLRTMCEDQKPTIYSLLLDRSMVYCGTSDKGILVLDFHNGQQVNIYNSGKGVVCMLMYRSLLFAGCYDGLIYVYNTKTQTHVSTIPGPGEGMLLSLAISNDVIVAGSKKDHLLKIWKIPQEIFNQIDICI